MMRDFESFLAWESASRDTIDFKKSYVDVAGDLVAGLVLSEIIYWYLPTRSGSTRLRVQHEGSLWIAVRYEDWWERCRVTADQARRALGILERAGIIIRDVFKFNGAPTTHIRVDAVKFLAALSAVVEGVRSGPEPRSIWAQTQNDLGQGPESLTESTAETTNTEGAVFQTARGEGTEEETGKEAESESFEDFEAWSADAMPVPTKLEYPPGFGPSGSIEEEFLAKSRARAAGPGSASGVVGRPLTQWDVIAPPGVGALRGLSPEEARIANAVGQFPADIQGLARAFIYAAGLFPRDKERGYWIKGLRELREGGITDEDIDFAVRETRGRNLTIKSPESIRAVALDRRARRAVPGKHHLLNFENANWTAEGRDGEAGK